MRDLVGRTVLLRDSRLWLLLLCALHAVVHQGGFHAVWLDPDQLVVADQAAWMARGEFHEPFFYGQAYLLPFEAYLAVPAVWLGLDPLVGVKAVAALSFYMPWVLTTWWLGRERPWAALGVTVLFFALPLEYTLAAALPRGFITGIALAWLGLALLLRPAAASAGAQIGWAALVGFCTGSYMSNVLMLPALVFLPDRRRWLLAGAGLLLGYALFKALGLFYVWNPDHVVHRFPDLAFTPGYLLGNLQNPDVVVALGGLLLLGLGAGALVMRAERRDPASLAGTDGWRWVLGAAGLLLLIALMVGNNKFAEYNAGSPFFSLYRMMLPLPLLALLVIARWAPTGQAWRVPLWGGLVLAVALAGVQLGRFVLGQERFIEAATTLEPVTRDKLRRVCKRLAQDWRRSGEPYVVLPHRDDLRAYGCHALYGVPVVQSDYERRTWLRRRFERDAAQ